MDEFNRILIVDDERQNIKILTEFLRDDYKIMAAKDGETAITALTKSTLPDLILLDIMMPGINGYEVIKQLKSNERTREIPVIFITALDATDDESLGFEMGAVDYITKPFKPVIVKARLKTHLQLKQKTDLLDRLASFDGLTQIPNRRNFDMVLEKEIGKTLRNGSLLSLLLMDIDHFKKFNDNYGHIEGDACLKKVALALKEVISRPGDFVARYGGEEFAMILPETDLKGAIHIARQAQQSVQRLCIPHATSKVSKYLSISIGVATKLSGKKDNPIELTQKADTALYQAKANGRNCVVSASQ
ncbi:diguanylate cyclase domain-containing protein [Desulfobacula toluolica]|uniref:diguanylate cyclase n=1 Tax=Desulfobacula toluolica (strain DSM 7467 / Tol2) TaxID=651182 RepID=K0NDT7_DESTT|nr:diguanylate cyclase [Desulfobacula toluolica]CCK79041.1 response regulator receiver modulated diguanylate cyclase [Desulfobacula toluolica Tol2]